MVIILLLQSSIFHVACCAECREKGAAKIANGSFCYRTTFSKKKQFGWRTAEDREYVISTKMTRLNNIKRRKQSYKTGLRQKRHEWQVQCLY